MQLVIRAPWLFSLLFLNLAAMKLAAEEGEECPAPAVYNQLHDSVAKLQDAMSKHPDSSQLPAHLLDEYNSLVQAESSAFHLSREIASRWDDLASKRWNADFEREDLEQKQREVDRDQESLNSDMSKLDRRIESHNMEATQQNAAAATAFDEASVLRANTWGAEINRRAASLNKEKSKYTQRQSDIDARRQKLATDLTRAAQKINQLVLENSALIHELSPFLVECGRNSNHALALAQLLDSGVEISTYTPKTRQLTYAESATQLGKDITESAAKDAWLALTKPAVSKAGWMGAAVTVGEVGIDAAYAAGDAGVDKRTREVERNLLLIGDYAQVLKRMKEGGTLKADDPAYQAIRSVLKEQGEAMPTDGADVLLEGLKSREALEAAATSVVSSVAGKYVGGKVKNYGLGGRTVESLPMADLKTLGTRQLNFFEAAIDAVAESGSSFITGKTVTKAGAWVSAQLNPPAPAPAGNETAPP